MGAKRARIAIDAMGGDYAPDEIVAGALKAKESAAKDNLRLLRNSIERYAQDHNGIPPGYPNNDRSALPDREVFVAQMTTYSSIGGQTNATKTATYSQGPYLSEIPKNPFTGSNFMGMVPNDLVFNPAGSNMFGWIYKPATKEIRIDSFGADSENKQIYDY